MVGTAALIIVLSAFNGLESLVSGFYNTFDPDLKVEPIKEKYFESATTPIEAISKLEGVEGLSQIMEERVLLTFRDMEHIATIKGVDKNYTNVTNLRGAITHGEYGIYPEGKVPQAVLGAGIAYFLGYGRISFEDPINVFVPRSGAAANFSNAFSSELIYPSGIFSVQPEFDEKYIFAPIDFVKKLLDRPGQLSSLEIKVKPGTDVEGIKKKVAKLLGSGFSVKNRQEQQAIFLKVMKSESLFTFLVFALILTIATFTIMGSLSMMMLDKKDHLRTLWSMGAEVSTLRAIFFKEGLIISAVGAGFGLFFGILIVWAQQRFGLLEIGQNYAVESYPVELKLKDILLVAATVAFLCSITSWITSRRLGFRLLSTIDS